MKDSLSVNKRIAKNTLLLYVRTFFVMLMTIYTSRVVLQQLGIEDYGIYQVVGGMVAMFSVVSNILSASISRFITYEIGSGNLLRLKMVFATSRFAQIVIAGIIFVSAEIVGMWFLKTQMQIPEGRIQATMWVFHCSVISFCINLLSIPYNACIIAHEHMSAFAYISLLDALLKLGICYLLIISPLDRLILYSILMMLISISIRVIYTIYCRHYFEESHAKLFFYRSIFKEMFSFAGWSFLTSANSVLCSHGVTMLINVFFGVIFNAARGLANQVKGAVLQFVNSFMVAINPQITKSYASGNMYEMYTLVCRGARFSYYLVLIMSLPLICEANTILSIWLVEVPDKTVVFVQLSMISVLLDGAGYTSYTANLATGRIRNYSIVLSITTIFVFPLTWIAYAWGGAVEYAYFVEFVSQIFFHIARMYLTQYNIGLKVRTFVKEVYIPVLKTTILSVIPSLLLVRILPPTYWRLALSIVLGSGIVGITILYVGMTHKERSLVLNKIKTIAHKFNW